MKQQFQLSDISIGCMMRRLVKDLWMVVAFGLIAAMGTSMLLSATHTDLYRSSITYSVTTRRTSYTSTNNLTAAKEAAATLSLMLESDAVLDTLKSDADLTGFDGTISATQTTNTNFITITVTDDSPEDALTAIRALQDIFPTFTAYLSDSVVQVIRNPSVSASPINQLDISGTARKMGLLGGAGMVVLLIWLYLRQNTVQTRSGARRALDGPIVATVCRERIRNSGPKASRAVQVFSPSASFAYTEQIGTICTRLEQESATRGAKVILVTGVREGEGKSTIAGNIAATLSLMGRRVALLDCDLRNPSLNRFFGGKYTAPLPLNQLLSRPLSKENLLSCMQRNEKLGIFMLFPEKPDKRCTELLCGDTMEQLLHQLRIFDYVILDTPPMGYFADAEALAEKADASLLVVRQDHTPAPEINDAIDILRASSANFLGCVLNGMTASVTEGYGKASGYGYGYGSYGKSRDRKGG